MLLAVGDDDWAGSFAETGGRTVVEGRLRDLAAGSHGIHVHAVGMCEPGPPASTSTGGHGDQPVISVLTDRTTESRSR